MANEVTDPKVPKKFLDLTGTQKVIEKIVGQIEETDQKTNSRISDIEKDIYTENKEIKFYTKEESDSRFVVDDYNGHEFIDLGLPSGILWAKANVGADSPTDYGLYFQWGDTKGYTYDELTSYEFVTNFTKYKYSGSEAGGTDNPQLSKYCNDAKYGENNSYTDDLVTLEESDDAVSYYMGGVWRMPTQDEWIELVNNTTYKFVENYDESGVSGTLFTSKNNGKTIFFPHSGCGYNSIPTLNGDTVYYWTSSVNAETCFRGNDISISKTYGINPTDSTVRFSFMPIKGIMPKNNGYLKKFEAEETYQVKGDYLTEHQSLDNYYTKEEVDDKLIEPNANGHDYVDLGLPSGTLWATSNVGADSPTDYGLYFQWGAKKGYRRGEFPLSGNFFTDSSSNLQGYVYADNTGKLTKYCYNSANGSNGFVDNLTELEYEDDAARIYMGGSWQIPSPDNLTELKENVTVEYVSDYNNSGIPGAKLISKINGNHIFIPGGGAGYWNAIAMDGAVAIWGNNVQLNSTGNTANTLMCMKDGTSLVWPDSTPRGYGIPIRGVLANTKYLTKKELEKTYQVKGNYLTEHQPLTNYYTKEQVDSKTDKIDEIENGLNNIKQSIELITNGETANEAFDTLKEVDTWIKSHESEAADIISDINDIKSELESLDEVEAISTDEIDEIFKSIFSKED